MKISIVGIGRVGSTLAYTVALKGLCHELVLVSRRPEVAEGEASDLHHAISLVDRPLDVRAGDVGATEASDLIVFCASVPAPAGVASRMDFLAGNAALVRTLVPTLAALSPNGVFLVISNPVDALTYLTLRVSGFPPARVVGTGTLVDSARFRALLSSAIGIHPEDVRAYILGEHGDGQFPYLSGAQAGGEPIVDEPRLRSMFEEAVSSGHRVFSSKGYTNFAVSLAAAMIIEAIAFDTKRTMPASVLIDGFYGVRDVCLSLPVVVGRGGVLRVLQPQLNEQEIAAFKKAAASVRAAIEQAGANRLQG